MWLVYWFTSQLSWIRNSNLKHRNKRSVHPDIMHAELMHTNNVYTGTWQVVSVFIRFVKQKPIFFPFFLCHNNNISFLFLIVSTLYKSSSVWQYNMWSHCYSNIRLICIPPTYHSTLSITLARKFYGWYLVQAFCLYIIYNHNDMAVDDISIVTYQPWSFDLLLNN